MAKTLLMADDSYEAEPVIIDTDHPGLVVLEFDDGHRLMLDEREPCRARDPGGRLIDTATLAQARTLVARLELVSHGRAMDFSPTRGGDRSALPPGGIAGKDDREPDHPQRSHLHYRRRLAHCRSTEDVERLIGDLEATLRAWQHTPRPPVDSRAWKEQVAADTRKPGVIAKDYKITRQYVWQIKKLYGEQRFDRARLD